MNWFCLYLLTLETKSFSFPSCLYCYMVNAAQGLWTKFVISTFCIFIPFPFTIIYVYSRPWWHYGYVFCGAGTSTAMHIFIFWCHWPCIDSRDTNATRTHLSSEAYDIDNLSRNISTFCTSDNKYRYLNLFKGFLFFCARGIKCSLYSHSSKRFIYSIPLFCCINISVFFFYLFIYLFTWTKKKKRTLLCIIVVGLRDEWNELT